jgi:microcystin-dependent protein
MSEPFLGEIRMVGFTFPPKGWALCNGQSMSISQNQALFSLLGTTYGGDGITTFALPNLQGRVPLHQGSLTGGGTYTLGQFAGVESVTLSATQMPSHTHGVNGSGAGGTQASPVGGYPAVESTGTSLDYISSPTNLGAMNAGMIQDTGGGQPHENRQPFLCVNFIIALTGVFPSRS